MEEHLIVLNYIFIAMMVVYDYIKSNFLTLKMNKLIKANSILSFCNPSIWDPSDFWALKNEFTSILKYSN